MNHNNQIYQDSNAYQIGRKDGYDEIMSQMRDIIDKCYNAGYKDAMDFACEWLKENIDGGVHPQSVYGFTKKFKKAMEEHLCKGI